MITKIEERLDDMKRKFRRADKFERENNKGEERGGNGRNRKRNGKEEESSYSGSWLE